MQTLYIYKKREGGTKPKEKIPTALYKNGHNWPMHMLCHLET